MAHGEMCQSCRISPGIQSWKMLLCPVYCSMVAFNPTRLQHHLGKAGMLFPFPPGWTCSCLGGRVMATSTCLCRFPWIYHSRSFLSGWWTEMGVFPHLAPCCPPHCGALPISHCTSPAPTSFPFFPVVCLHPYPLYAQPCSLCVKSSSFWQ